MDNYIYEKSIKVSEPKCWSEGKVQLFVLPYGKTARIMFNFGDFFVYQDISDWDRETNIQWAKTYFWDKLPETISLSWLYEHGYKPL